MTKREPTKKQSGKLKIGDDWNAITIIALSQNNPLKAIAEFVENSIDARSRYISVIRGREKGVHYLKIIDDGNGVPLNEEGLPDFKYVATHICDSIKRRMKAQGAVRIQGEFGIGLLSFWTVGERLTMISADKHGKMHQMVMEKGGSGYSVSPRPHLTGTKGTELIIAPLLEGNRSLSGEKVLRYLASELRDRIRSSEVKIKVIDRVTRMEAIVEPRRFEGQLVHQVPQVKTPLGEVYMEIYLNPLDSGNGISLFRSGTRVLPSIGVLDEFQGQPWEAGYFQGIIDAPFLNLTPGTRDGIIRDSAYAIFSDHMAPVKSFLDALALEQSKAEEERASKNILRSVQKAFRDAVLELPVEEYDWFDSSARKRELAAAPASPSGDPDDELSSSLDVAGPVGAGAVVPAFEEAKTGQKKFFECAGPLFSARINPASVLVEVGQTRKLSAVGLDKSKRKVDGALECSWSIIEGEGKLAPTDGEHVEFSAPQQPGICRMKAIVKQGETTVEAEAVVTVVAQLIKINKEGEAPSKGLPNYTLERATGQIWRSRYEEKHNLIVINSGHRDFIYASQQAARKLRYICRLFAKELILHHFTGMPPEELLERLIELSLYTEENLK